MKITKYVHSCLLVETDQRVALFDPGVMSEEALDIAAIDRLDDIFITHSHVDHCSKKLMKQLVAKFPDVRITAPEDVVTVLAEESIRASKQAPNGVSFFTAPHEPVEPLFPTPPQIGIHYEGVLTDPGDSHTFTETKAILALPITAPWGSSVRALNLTLALHPKHVLPIHDWHWSEAAKGNMYENYERVLGEHSITFHKLETGQPVEIVV